MFSFSARRALTGVCALLIAGFTATPAGAANPAGRLTFESVTVSPASVDASEGTGKVHLTWTLDDTVAGVSDVKGDLTLKRTDGTGVFTVSFDYLYGNGASGTVQHPTFSDDFDVPQYARTASAQYQVTKIAATDDQGGAVTVTGTRLAAAKFTATEATDTTAPTHDTPVIVAWSTSAIYNRDRSGTVTYAVNVHDAEAGIDGGKLVVKAPDGSTVTAPFRWDPYGADGQCEPDVHNPQCIVDVTIPANAAAGTWTVDRLTLTDAAGNTARFTGLNAAPLTVSANRRIQAADFAFDPAQVDNWHENRLTHLKFTTSGVRGGLSAVHTALSGACSAGTPVLGDDGSVDVPVTVLSIASSCSVSGITVTDNAGDTSLYGTDSGAPDLNLSVTRTPDTDPPVADSVKLYWTTMPDGTDYQVDNAVLAHTISRVGVTQFSVTVFDSSGVSVGGGGGGTAADSSGNVDLEFSVPRTLAPGTYTVAFMLYDAGGLHTFYGYPGTEQPPGGPLTFVVPAP